MINMKTFKEFINESIRDQMVGKSFDEIKKLLKNSNPIEKLIIINKNKLPSDFRPSDEELKNYIKNNIIKSKILIDDNRYFLSDISEFEPTDEELKNYIRTLPIPEQLKLTHNDTLIHLKPDKDDIIEYLVSLDRQKREEFIKKYNIMGYLRRDVFQIGNFLSDIFIHRDGYIPIDNKSIGKFINNEKDEILLNIGSVHDLYQYYTSGDKLKPYYKKI